MGDGGGLALRPSPAELPGSRHYPQAWPPAPGTEMELGFAFTDRLLSREKLLRIKTAVLLSR